MDRLNQCQRKPTAEKDLTMVNFWAIVGCSNRGDREKDKSYYRLPAVIHIRGAATEEKQNERLVAVQNCEIRYFKEYSALHSSVL